MRILTNAPGQSTSAIWRSVAEFRRAPQRGFVRTFGHALRLYREAKHYDCVVLGAGRADSLYCLLAALLPFRRPPCVRIDCLWYLPDRALPRLLKRLQRRFETRAVTAYIVWARREIEAYSTAFGLPRDRFLFVPYHHTLNNVPLAPQDGGYVFSGGNFSRDYKTLVAAVAPLPFPVKIACSFPEALRGVEVPSHVDVRAYHPEEYLQVLAGCRINVVAMRAADLHSGGQQTLLNSMALGKPTIVTDPEGARDYIEDGVTGVLVEPGNVAALRGQIERLMTDQDAARQMGARASEVARRHSTEAHFQELVNTVKRVLQLRHT